MKPLKIDSIYTWLMESFIFPFSSKTTAKIYLCGILPLIQTDWNQQLVKIEITPQKRDFHIAAIHSIAGCYAFCPLEARELHIRLCVALTFKFHFLCLVYLTTFTV